MKQNVNERIRGITERKIFLLVVEVFSYLMPLLYLYLIRFLILTGNNYITILKFQNDIEKAKFVDFTTLLIYVIVFTRKDIKRLGFNSICIEYLKRWRLFIWGMGIGLLLNSVIYFMTFIPYISDGIKGYLDTSAQNLDGTNSVLLFISVVVLSPIVEEYVFRKVIYSRLKIKIKLLYAIILASVLFGITHVLSVIWMLVAFVFSIILCLTYENHGYMGCLAVHMGCNSLVVVNWLINVVINNSKDISIIVLIIYILYFIMGVVLVFIIMQGINGELYRSWKKCLS